MTDTIRVLRVLEYTGPRSVLVKQLEQRVVKGTFVPGPTVTIREGFIGEFPEVLSKDYPFPSAASMDSRVTNALKREHITLATAKQLSDHEILLIEGIGQEGLRYIRTAPTETTEEQLDRLWPQSAPKVCGRIPDCDRREGHVGDCMSEDDPRFLKEPDHA